jgi:hypothetical protein
MSKYKFTLDGELMLAFERPNIVIRDAKTGDVRKTLPVDRSIGSIDIHPNNRSLITLSYYGEVWVHDLSVDSDSGRHVYGSSIVQDSLLSITR